MRVLVDIQPNVRRESAQVKPGPQVKPIVEELDCSRLLLSLADEYLHVAYSTNDRSELFYKLVATALGCLESVLSNFKLQPLKEAQVSLRYSQVLFEETENVDEAENVLTKAIEVCERNQFIDLRYASQMLLAQVLHRSRPRAAVKDLSGLIDEATTYKHVAWEYALRFLQISFSISSGLQHDFHSAVKQLEKIETIAKQQQDHAVFAFAAVMEAFVHLRIANHEAINRALAKARQLQLNPEVAENAQLQLLIELIDLCSSVQAYELPQVEQKLKCMQQSMYEVLEKADWQDDGMMRVPVSRRSMNGVLMQDGGVLTEKAGIIYLCFRWLLKCDIETLGYLISATSISYKNGADGGKAGKYLEEGFDRLCAIRNDEKKARTSSAQLQNASTQRAALECHFLVEKAFLMCAKGSWTAAHETLANLEEVARSHNISLPLDLRAVAQYLNGIIHQGTGDLDEAIAIFQAPIFALLPSRATSEASAPKQSTHALERPESEALSRLALLAQLNTAFIIHTTNGPRYPSLQSLISTLEKHIQLSSNRQLQAAYSLLLATLSDSSVLKQKQFLGNALSTAQAIGNAQITALALVLMSEKFFNGVVGDQAVKCARAASHQAKRVGDPLWMAVTLRMEAQCMETQGKVGEASRLTRESERLRADLPDRLKRLVG